MTRALVILALFTSVAYADQPVRGTCDAAAIEKTGDDSFAKAFWMQAFDQFEKAIRCKPSELRYLKAVVSACKAYNLHTEGGQSAFKARAMKYFKQLSKQGQDKAAKICTTYHDRGLFTND